MLLLFQWRHQHCATRTLAHKKKTVFSRGRPVYFISGPPKHRSARLGALHNMGYQSETHHRLKSHEISFFHNIRVSYPIILKFCPEHGNENAIMHSIKCQNDWLTEKQVMSKQDFMEFWFKCIFGQISYIAQHPRFFSCWCSAGQLTDLHFQYPSSGIIFWRW